MSTSATERVSEVCKTVSTYWAQGREYYQLPSTTYYNNTSCCGGASGELGLGASRVQKLLCRRSRYYWAAFFSQSLQYFLQIILFYSSTYFAATTRFVLVTGQSMMWLVCWGVLCLKKYNTDTNDLQEIRRNALIHIFYSLFSMLCCLLTISFMCIVSASHNPDGHLFLRPLILTLLVVCAASSCVAARLTFLALKHSRIAGSVTIALPNTNNNASAGPLDLGARTSLAAAETDATTRLLADTDTP